MFGMFAAHFPTLALLARAAGGPLYVTFNLSCVC